MSEAISSVAKGDIAGEEPDGPIELAVADLDSDSVERILVSPALGRALVRAAAVSGPEIEPGLERRPDVRARPIARSSAGGDAPADLSFASLIVGLATSEDATARWLRRYFAEQRVAVEHLYDKLDKPATAVRALAERAMKGASTTREMVARAPSPMRWTSSARRVMLEARGIAKAQGSAELLRVPDLIAAFITVTDYHTDDFKRLGLDREKWAVAFLGYLMVSGAPDVDGWRSLFARRFPDLPTDKRTYPPPTAPAQEVETDDSGRRGARPDFDPDAYTERDLLGIEDEVRALAYVIASVKTSPPLAIGLFGDWGSGKTFFMSHLRRRIEKMCDASRHQPAATRTCHAHIAQIEFNAWHYQRGDLWASLVDHIFRNLRFGENEEETKLAERRDRLLRSLEDATHRSGDAGSRAAAARRRAADADKRLAKLKRREEQRREALAAELAPAQLLAAARAGVELDRPLVRQGQKLLGNLGLPQASSSASELQSALVDAKQELSGLGAFLAPLLYGKDRFARALLLLTAIAAPVALGLVLSWALSGWAGELVGDVGAAISTLAAMAAGLAQWIKKQTEWVREQRARIDPLVRSVDAQIQARIDEKLSAQKQKVANQLAELDAIKQEEAEALEEKRAADAEASALNVSLGDLGRDQLLRAFLDERIADGEYQKRLGIEALVRRDFERLSRHLETLTKKEREGRLEEGEQPINRIVLYIDDLDRCQGEQVVKVLQAVHLLLAFKAFVVVVGVDSRWVAHCLERHLGEVLAIEDGDVREGGHAPLVTPLDYLEKIFQIPIWLEPISEKGRVHMARTLLLGSSRDQATVPTAPADALDAAVAGEAPAREATPGRESASNGGGDGEPRGTAAPPAEADDATDRGQPAATSTEEAIDLDPGGLTITEDEDRFLERLAPLLSSSPRVLKRFVNTHRLISVGFAERPAPAPRTPSDTEVRMLLLAIFVAMPELSRVIQDVLQKVTTGETAPLSPLVAKALAPSAAPSPFLSEPFSKGRARRQWAAVEAWLLEQEPAWRDLPSGRLVEWLVQVGRYTFLLTRGG